MFVALQNPNVSFSNKFVASRRKYFHSNNTIDTVRFRVTTTLSKMCDVRKIVGFHETANVIIRGNNKNCVAQNDFQAENYLSKPLHVSSYKNASRSKISSQLTLPSVL